MRMHQLTSFSFYVQDVGRSQHQLDMDGLLYLRPQTLIGLCCAVASSLPASTLALGLLYTLAALSNHFNGADLLRPLRQPLA